MLTTPPEAGATSPGIARRLRVVLIVVAASQLIMGFTATAMNIVFPTVEGAFSSTPRSVLAWGITGFATLQASLLLINGRLADRVGRATVYTRGLLIFGGASLVTAFAPTAEVFIAGRLGQAVGAASVMSSALALIMEEFPASRRVWVATITHGVMSIGQALSPPLASLLADVFSWRAVFLWPAVMTVAILIISPRVLREAPRPRVVQRIDILGATMGTAGVGACVHAVTTGPQGNWLDPSVLVSLGLAAVLLPLVVVRSTRHPVPLFEPSVVRVHSVWSAMTIGFLSSAVGVATWFGWPLLLIRGLDESVFRAGLLLTPVPAVMALASFGAGRIIDRVGPMIVIFTGGCAWIVSIALLLIGLDGEPTYVADLLPAFLVSGVAWGFTIGPLNGLAVRDVDSERMAQVQALIGTLRFVGSAIGPAVVIGMLGDGDVLPISAFVRLHQVLLIGAIVTAALTLVLLNRGRARARAAASAADLAVVLPHQPAP